MIEIGSRIASNGAEFEGGASGDFNGDGSDWKGALMICLNNMASGKTVQLPEWLEVKWKNWVKNLGLQTSLLLCVPISFEMQCLKWVMLVKTRVMISFVVRQLNFLK